MLKVNEYRFAWVEADGVNWWVMTPYLSRENKEYAH